MTVARELAEFLTRTSSSDLPRQAVDHAAMLIASTIASRRNVSSYRNYADVAGESTAHPRPSIG
jgi:hypothetical protein